MPIDATQPVNEPNPGEDIEAVWGAAVAEHVIQRFADEAERDAKWTNPPEGAMCVVTSGTNRGTVFQVLNGGWIVIYDAHGSGSTAYGQDKTLVVEPTTARVRGGLVVSPDGLGFPTGAGGTSQHGILLRANGAVDIRNSDAANAALAVSALNAATDGMLVFWGYRNELGRFKRAANKTNLELTVAAGGNLELGGIQTGGSGQPTLHINGNNEVMKTTSSRRYKHDIAPLDVSYADAILNLAPSSFKWNDGGHSGVGLIAEEAAVVDEMFVGTAPDPGQEPDRVDEEYDDQGNVVNGDAVNAAQDARLGWLESAPLVPNSINWEAVSTGLVSLCQRQEAQIANLTARLEALESA